MNICNGTGIYIHTRTLYNVHVVDCIQTTHMNDSNSWNQEKVLVPTQGLDYISPGIMNRFREHI